MPAISTNDLKNGMTLDLDGDLVSIVEFQHVKPGKGHAFVRTKLKNVRTGAVVDRTFRADERVERAIIDKREKQFLYRDADDLVFMDSETYEQGPVPEALLGDAMKYLLEGREVLLMMYGDEVVGVDLPAAIELTVEQTDPGLQGDRVSGARKPATLETGLVVQVPLFVDTGDVVKVDTRSGEYLTPRVTGLGSRREARETALAIVYEADVRGESLGDALARQVLEPDAYVRELVVGLEEHRAEVDAAISAVLEGWTLGRLPAIDRSLLRIAAFELAYRDDVPTSAVISEAVELAAQYSTEASAKFVNGVLATLAKRLR